MIAWIKGSVDSIQGDEGEKEVEEEPRDLATIRYNAEALHFLADTSERQYILHYIKDSAAQRKCPVLVGEYSSGIRDPFIISPSFKSPAHLHDAVAHEDKEQIEGQAEDNRCCLQTSQSVITAGQ